MVIFAMDKAPPGIDLRLVEFWQDRPWLDSWRSIFVHTMAASVPTSVQSAWNYAHSKPHANTCPTYAVGLEAGDAAKFLPSDRRGIATATVTSTTTRDGQLVWPTLEQWQRDEIVQWGNVRDWSLSIETADTGYIADPAISAFNDWQIEAVSVIIAYEAHVGGFPLDMIDRWFGAGVGSHTDPDGYPFTTLWPGKHCPGARKKTQTRAEIIPEARRILAAWTEIPTQEEDDMRRYLARLDTNAYHYRVGDGIRAEVLRSNEYGALKARFIAGTLPAEAQYHNPHTGNRITAWDAIPILNETQLDLDVGYVTEAGKEDEG